MNLTTENILLVGSILLLISIIAGNTSYRFGAPTLVLFLMIRMLAGSDGIGSIYFDNPRTVQFIGIVLLNFILFSDGCFLVRYGLSYWPVVGRIIFPSALKRRS